MDHVDAVNGQAVERYLLGEMTEGEADSFERHFFECAVCTEELASGATLAENVKAVSAPEQAAAPAVSTLKPTRWWRRPIFAAPVFAAAALAIVVGYQASEIARLSRPQTLAVYTLRSETRGGEQRLSVPAGATHFAVNVDLPEDAYPAYRCTLQNDSGSTLFSVESPAPPAGMPLSVLIPSRGMHSGVYTLRIHGVRGSATGPEVARFRFSL